MRELVSVVTGTWKRHDLLIGLIENVRQSSYRPIEHCIVSDGPDPELRTKIDQIRDDTDVPIHFVEVGRNWSSFLAASLSTVPFQTAQWLARGAYLVWAADDERMEPDHIASLVELLERTDSDFVYSRCRLVYHPDLGERPDEIIGSDPPYKGGITNALFRAELLDYRGFTTHVGSGTDWDQVEHWITAGARYAMLDRVTLTHRVDKIGEGPDFHAERQPLRGQRVRV